MYLSNVLFCGVRAPLVERLCVNVAKYEDWRIFKICLEYACAQIACGLPARGQRVAVRMEIAAPNTAGVPFQLDS